MKVIIFSFLCLVALQAEKAVASSILIGTYTLNYRDNAAGSATDQSNPDYSQANPYFGNLIAPGPIFIDAAPGQYTLDVLSGVGCSLWNGDASGGTWQSTGSVGNILSFTHTTGQIVFYFWDWIPSDNDPNVKTEISLFAETQSVPDAGASSGILLASALVGLVFVSRVSRKTAQ